MTPFLYLNCIDEWSKILFRCQKLSFSSEIIFGLAFIDIWQFFSGHTAHVYQRIHPYLHLAIQLSIYLPTYEGTYRFDKKLGLPIAICFLLKSILFTFNHKRGLFEGDPTLVRKSLYWKLLLQMPIFQNRPKTFPGMYGAQYLDNCVVS